MSGLTVGIATGPMERVAADVAVVTFFADERPLRGDAGRVDWRLCGALARLIQRGKLSGAWGEAALVPSTGGLRAAWVLALGLGERADFDPERRGHGARVAVERALDLGAAVLALPLPPAAPGVDADPGARLELLLSALGEAATAADGPRPRVRIRLVPPESEHAAVMERFLALARRPAPVGLDLEPPEPAPRIAGRRTAAAAARSGHGDAPAGLRVK